VASFNELLGFVSSIVLSITWQRLWPILLTFIIVTMLGAYVFKHIPNRIFRYIVYAYICISGVIILIILITNV